jgi:hypothetical protein
VSTRVSSLLVIVALGSLLGCGPKVIVATGTTLGLKATPGDGQTRPPQVTLGYKRAEVAIVPTDGKDANGTEDAYSAMAAFDFSSKWFGKTELSSFIATGNAARDIQGENDEFITAVANATAVPVAGDVQARKVALIERWNSLTEAEAGQILVTLGRAVRTGNTAKEELQDAIARANAPDDLVAIENAFTANGV